MSQLRIFALITIASVALLGCSAKENSELTAAQEEAVAERIAPVGHVVKAGQVVAVVCCWRRRAFRQRYLWHQLHGLPHFWVAGAPMLGDAGAWADRLTKGIETVYTNAINGINGMPARGTCMDCSDDEVIAAIDYILDNSK